MAESASSEHKPETRRADLFRRRRWTAKDEEIVARVQELMASVRRARVTERTCAHMTREKKKTFIRDQNAAIKNTFSIVETHECECRAKAIWFAHVKRDTRTTQIVLINSKTKRRNFQMKFIIFHEAKLSFALKWIRSRLPLCKVTDAEKEKKKMNEQVKRTNTAKNNYGKFQFINSVVNFGTRIAAVNFTLFSLRRSSFAVNLHKQMREEKKMRREKKGMRWTKPQHLNMQRQCLIPFYDEKFKLVASPSSRILQSTQMTFCVYFWRISTRWRWTTK